MSKSKLHEIKLESLRAQLGFLEAIKGRHEIWAGGVNDEEIKSAHRRILKLVREVRDEYVALLRLYDQEP